MKKSGSSKSEPANYFNKEDTGANLVERKSEAEEVSAKADDFINKFKEQLKLQRLDSILRYKEMIQGQSSRSFDSLPTRSKGRTVYYNVLDEDGRIDKSRKESYFIFKGNRLDELIDKLKEETGLKDVIVYSRNALTGKLHPLRFGLPPNNGTMHISVVPSSFKVATDVDSSKERQETKESYIKEWPSRGIMSMRSIELSEPGEIVPVRDAEEGPVKDKNLLANKLFEPQESPEIQEAEEQVVKEVNLMKNKLPELQEGRETQEAKEWVVEKMNLMNNNLSELPESPRFPFLVKLFLQWNPNLMVIPHSFFECMPILQVLDLSYTSIKSLPKSISKLVALREFFLRGCDLLMELPPEIGELKKLEVFDLEGTEIMYLPKEIGELICLTSLKVSLSGSADLCKENKGVDTIIPEEVLSNLSLLEELSIDVHPDGDWWDFEVKGIINELCTLEKLKFLKLYVPICEQMKDLRWNSTSLMYPALERFRFVVGHREQRFISRVPLEVENNFNNLDYFAKGLKYINGEGIPTEVTKVLKHANAFFLERHWTVKSLSEFGLENMENLKFFCLVECNEFRTIIDADIDFDEVIVLGSLQYLSVHYMKNMESIFEGPFRKVRLFNLTSLALHTCPSLSTIFTLGMLGGLISLEELIVEDCPKINSLVSLECSISESDHFLPSLKKISLLELPELVSIFGGLCIAPNLESMIFFYCPKLEILSSKEVSSRNLRVIKGDSEWWDALKWYKSDLTPDHRDYLVQKFIPLDIDGDLMAQLKH